MMDKESQAQEILKQYLTSATAEQRHIFAAQSNYDGNASELKLLVDSPQTDIATATLIFWNYGADYLTRITPADMPDYQCKKLEFLQLIQQRCLDGFYLSNAIFYDPKDGPCYPGEFVSVGERVTGIDRSMEQARTGSEWVDLALAAEEYDDGLPAEIAEALWKLWDSPN